MGRSPCCDETGLKKGPWTPEEDQKLVKHIQKHGHGSWRALPSLAGLNRCGKSCRLRWTNYLRPDIKRGKFSNDEEQTILNLHAVLGNKWSSIATQLPRRTDNEIKNYWNTHLKKKLIQMGIDPTTHRPRTDIFSSIPLLALASFKDLMDHNPLISWEEQTAMKLQTDQVIQMAKLQYLNFLLQPPAQPPLLTTIPNYTTNNVPSSNDQLNIDVNNYGNLSSLSPSSLLSHESPSQDQLPEQLIVKNNTNYGHQQKLDLIHDLIPFSHMPDLQVPCGSFDVKDENLGGISIFSDPWLPSTPNLSPSISDTAVPPMTDTSIGGSGGGDACSTSSSYCGNPTQFWPDHVLLQDPLFNDLP